MIMGRIFSFVGGWLGVSESVAGVDEAGLPVVNCRQWTFDVEMAKKVITDFPDMPDEIRQQIEAA